MANTTVQNVLAIAPELSAVGQEAWDLILADVAGAVTEQVYGPKQEQAQRYLAAHLLTMITKDDSATFGVVTSEKTGDVATGYADTTGYDDLEKTKFGREFKRIRRGTVAGFMTVRP